MNKYVDNTICSHTSVERYLLNRMTTGEETVFQEHLHTCNTCKVYLDTLRNLSMILNEESPERTGIKQAPTFSLSATMRWLMVAACLLPLFGIMLYRLLHEPGTPHNTQITHQNKASIAYVDTTWVLFSPIHPVSIVNPAEEEIVFRWDRESAYCLQLEADGQTVAVIDSTGTACTIDPLLAVRYEQFDWTLTIGGKELKGRLFIQKK